MFFQQVVWAVIYTKILIDTLALDISVVPIKINNRLMKILYSNTITTKCTTAIAVYLLLFGEIFLV